MTNDQQRVWDLFFTSVVGIQFHPANHALHLEPENLAPMLQACGRIADAMMIERTKRAT